MKATHQLHKHFDTVLTQWKEQRDPYVWRLGLSAQFYADGIHMLTEALVQCGNNEFLYGTDYAPIALILLAEWYKREYNGNNADSPDWVKDTQWKDIWAASGKRHWERWVYRFEESGNFSWQYSAYVLGGIACRFICEQDKGNRLLKDLCRLFHGQIDETAIDASGNARALAMSIDKEGSIYHFIMELMDTSSPLSIAYSNDYQEEVRNLRKKIMEANKEVTKKKLRSEWRFTTSPYDQENLYRSLRISLAPERVDGEKRWFLSRDRAMEWGIKLTDTLTDIYVMLTLYKNGEPIADPICVMNFQPSGSLNAGFNILDEHPWYVQSDLPADFDGWRLSATTNDGQQADIDPMINPVGDWTQVYQTARNANMWSSNRRRMSTAVIFNDRCRITDPVGHPVAGKMLLVDNSPVRHLNWADIPVYVKLSYPIKGGKHKEERLVSPLADCRLTAGPLFPDLIDYMPGGYITVIRKDPQTGEIEEEQMPLAFGLDHISLIWLENGKHPTITVAERISAKQNGEEKVISQLKKGVAELTAYTSGMQATAKVWYIPADGKASAPGKRDLKKNRVVWGTKSFTASTSDTMDELQPTITIEDGDLFGNKAIIKIFQPVERTEIWLGDRLAKIISSDEHIYISLMSLPHITIRRFDDSGYRSWVGAEHLNEFKGLRRPVSDTQKTEIPNISIINFKADTPNRRDLLEIGDYLLEKGAPTLKFTAPCYARLNDEQDDDPFGDDPFGDDGNEPMSMNPVELLEAAIEYDIHTFFFDELFNRKESVANWIDEIRLRRGDDFIITHRDSVARILWEYELTTKDLNFKI